MRVIRKIEHNVIGPYKQVSVVRPHGQSTIFRTSLVTFHNLFVCYVTATSSVTGKLQKMLVFIKLVIKSFYAKKHNDKIVGQTKFREIFSFR